MVTVGSFRRSACSARGVAALAMVLSAGCGDGASARRDAGIIPPHETSCLLGRTEVRELRDIHQDPYEDTAGGPDGLAVDAWGARFLAAAPLDPFTIHGVNDLCLSGGVYDPGIADDEPDWEVFHHAQGIYLRDTPRVIVEGVAVLDSGDGIRFTEGTNDWVLRNSYFRHTGDDGIENDFLYSGLIDDVLIDWAWMGISCRLGSTDRFQGYSPGGTVTVQNSLMALRPQVGVYEPASNPSPGHAGFFKWEYYDVPGCKLRLINNVFLATQEANGTGLYLDPSDSSDVPYDSLVESSDNVIVWLGEGPYPAPVPDGFTLTTDARIWDQARAAWFSRHPEFAAYR